MGVIGGGGGTRSRPCNSGWHNIKLYKHFTIIPPLKQFIKFKI